MNQATPNQVSLYIEYIYIHVYTPYIEQIAETFARAPIKFLFYAYCAFEYAH